MVIDVSRVRPLLEATCDLVAASLRDIEATRYDITYKPDGSPVTSADLLVERLIRELLVERLGELTFVGEESYRGEDGWQRGWVAVLDPVDGTENLCAGLPEWGVSLSLWHDGEHRGSLLLLPELGRRLMTGDRLAPRRSRITGLSSSFAPTVASELEAAGEGRITGCAVYNLFNVIHGSFARFVNPVGARVWDLIGGISLAREHGCLVTIDGDAYDGRFLDPTRTHRVDVRHRHDGDPGQGPVGR